MESQDKNGGANFLKAWREYRGFTQQVLAAMVETTQHQIAYLENGDRALSAKWLRKLAPALQTTPGMLLDHDPNELDNDVIDIWAHAGTRERQQITDIARAIVKTGTDS